MNKIIAREDIHGWFDWEDIYLSALSNTDNGIFVEVGSWMGKSACFMAEHLKASEKNISFFCVDIWDDSFFIDDHSLNVYKKTYGVDTLLDIFKYNLQKYDVLDFVTIKQMTSVEAAKTFEDESLDLVFLDALHDYESVKTDLNAWYPKLKKNGLFAGHDFFWSPDGVQKAVTEFTKQNNLNFKTSNQSWFLEKP